MYATPAKKGQKKGRKNKNTPLPQAEPNQSMKSNKDNNLSYKQLGPRKQAT